MKGGYIVVGEDLGDYLGESVARGQMPILGRSGKYIGIVMVEGKTIRESIPLAHVGIAPPRNPLGELIQKLNEIDMLG